MVADYHISNFLKINNVEIKWICDTSKEALTRTAEKYKLQGICTDYKKILNDKFINAVIICTSPHSHYQIGMESIQAKKHVLLEKPIAVTREETYRLYDEASKNPEIVIFECSSRHSRLQPKFFAIKKIIQSGQLGQIYYIHHSAIYRNSRPGIEYHPNAKWFYKKELSGGGPLLDWGVYDLSFHLGILNDNPKLKSIKSFTLNGLDSKSRNNKEFNVEEHGLVSMEFDTGLNYLWERSSHANNETPNQTKIYGTHGGLKFSYLSWEANEVTYYSEKNDTPMEEKFLIAMGNHTSHEHDFYELDNHFVQCVLKKEKPILPLSLAVKHLDIIFKALNN